MTKVEVSSLGPVEVRDLAVQLDIVSTKKLGQNFIHNVNTIRRTVVTADLPGSSYPVEIDPGLDSLTLGLLEHYGRTTVVEINHRLAAHLPQTVTECAESCALELIEKGTLEVSHKDFQTTPDTLVTNLLYSVFVPVLLHVLTGLPTIRRMLVMTQSEVAGRLAARPGSKIYGVPSVRAAYYGTIRHARAIGPHVLWPVPKADSRLVRIDCYARSDTPETPDISGAPEVAPWEIPPQFRAWLFLLIDAVFTRRRKILRAVLSGICGSGAAAEEVLMAVGINPRQRGEKFETADSVRLAEVSR